LDLGKTWSNARVIPASYTPAYEISNPIVDAGRNIWLAPAAILPEKNRLGERVVVFRSTDGGSTWPEQSTVMYDQAGEKGFFEQKIIDLGNGRLLAVAWTVTLGDYQDIENHFAVTEDYGYTWSEAAPSGISSTVWRAAKRIQVLTGERYALQRHR
jgi:hypothetical protein